MKERRDTFRTIVADPPWPYKGSWGIGRIPKGREHDGRRMAALPYPPMTVEEIRSLPVGALAEEDAHLYLWTTNRFIFEAQQIAEAWGFKYSQTLIWAKTPMGKGPGGAFAQNAEYILFCRRGSLRHQVKQNTVWFNWRRTGKHSAKPPESFDLIEQVSPGPYLELFSRATEPRIGWSYWGNESLNTAEMPEAA